MSLKKYDSTVAPIAGNIAPAAMVDHDWSDGDVAYTRLAVHVVAIARAIIAETRRTEPPTDLERDLDAVMAGVRQRDAERAK